MGEENIENIKLNEKSFNEVSQAIKNMSASLDDLEEQIIKYESLLNYYTSPDWKDDYNFSNTEEFPKDVPHGILSEDGFYNEIGNFRELAIRMLKIGTKMIEI